MRTSKVSARGDCGYGHTCVFCATVLPRWNSRETRLIEFEISRWREFADEAQVPALRAAEIQHLISQHQLEGKAHAFGRPICSVSHWVRQRRGPKHGHSQPADRAARPTAEGRLANRQPALRPADPIQICIGDAVGIALSEIALDQ